MLRMVVNPSGETPVFQQIVEQVVEAVVSGRLIPGEQLPSHRDLAKQLVIAPLNVKRAYDELAEQGYAVVRQSSVTCIAERPPPITDAERQKRLSPLIRRLLVQAAVLGVSPDELQRLITEEAEELRRSSRVPTRASGDQWSRD
jgi:GntR family transcriptional regulator